MSIAICRVDKCSSAHDIVGIQIHNRRERQSSHSNPDIDFNRSGDNYSLCDRSNGLSFNAAIDEIINAEYTSKRTIRKDAVRMVQVLFTSDSEFFSDKSVSEQRAFFESCYKWAAEKWGESRIISADVHLDEKTPHMHLNFVPLVEDVDKKTGDIITTLNVHKAVGSGSRALQKLQDEFYNAVGKSYGMERGIRADLDNGEQPRKNQRTEQYKEATKYHKNETDALRRTLRGLQSTIDEYSDILHSEPQNAVQGISVPSAAKLLLRKENKDKLLYSPNDIAELQELAKATAVTVAANTKRSSELEQQAMELKQQAAEQAQIAAQLSERERVASQSYKKAADVRLSAEKLMEQAEKLMKKAEKMRKYYETSEPMIKDLQQQLEDFRTDLCAETQNSRNLSIELQNVKDELQKEKSENVKLSDKVHKFWLRSMDDAKEIKSAQEQTRQQNLELSESIHILEEENEKLKQDYDILCGLYDTAEECGDYICKKIGYDFKRVLEMRNDNYKLSYIFDEGKGMDR